MTDEKQNEWTNLETSIVKLWIDSDRSRDWEDFARCYRNQPRTITSPGSLARVLSGTIREDTPWINEAPYAALLDAALDRVNWEQIADSMLNGLEQSEPRLFGSEPVLIFAYTRAQAIADGVLVDVSKLAKEAGFKIPVALTEAAWQTCVRIPDGVTCQDEVGRLWDVLNVLLFAIRAGQNKPNPSEIRFTVSVRNSNDGNEDIQLKSLCTPGDDSEPVVTIMLPHED